MPSGYDLTDDFIKNKIEKLGYTCHDIFTLDGKIFVIIEDSDSYMYSYPYSSIGNSTPRMVDKSNEFSIRNISVWLLKNNLSIKILENNKYISAKKNLDFFCEECNDYFSTTWDSIRHRKRCSKCSGRSVGKYNNLEYLRPDLLNEWDYEKNIILPSQVTLSMSKDIFWICSKCGNSWDTKVYNRTKNNSGCPDCNKGSPKRKTNEEFVEQIKKIYGNEYVPMEEYKGSSTNINVLHTLCNNIWKVSPSNLLGGKGCPRCASSKGEKRIHNLFSKKGINNIPEKIFDDCRNILPLPFDFYLPDYNLCIEYHGEQHFECREFFGGEEGFKQRKINDKIKEDYCRDNGINLLIIPYWEFDNIEEILISTLEEIERSTNA